MSSPPGNLPETPSKNGSSGFSKRKTRRAREEALYEQYEASFRRHELTHQHWDPALSSFILRRPDSGTFYTEIMVSARSVTLQGDLHLMSFSGGPPDHLAKIAWLTRARGVYLEEKASIGTGCAEMVWDHEVDFAFQDVLENRRQRCLSREQARGAWETLQSDRSPQEATRFVYETGEVDDLEDLGRCMGIRVILAHVAVRRLAQLVL